MMNITRSFSLVCVLGICTLSGFTTNANGQPETPQANISDPGAPAEAIERWHSRRFGMFIHWGPVALTGHEIGWSRGRETPIDKYDQLYKQFNPEKFDADGNLLFNVGPIADGRIESRQVDRLREMGAWVKRHDQAIDGTRGGPFKPGKWGAATCKGDKIFLFVMNWPKEGPLALPAITAKVTNARLLRGDALKVQQNEGAVKVDVPAVQRDDIATVVQLMVNRPAFDIDPVAVVHHSNPLSYGKKALASNVFQKTKQYSPDKALDDDPETRWATDAGTSAAWIEIVRGQPTSVGRVGIDEPAEYRRVKAFDLQYHDGTAWQTFHTGATIGPNWSKIVTPVTAQRFRLNITRATEGPTLSEVQLFAPGK